MDFDFSEDQQSLRDAVQRWVEGDYSFEQRQLIVRAGGFSREKWDGLMSLGLGGLVVPETYGGLGMGAVETMVVMEELGRGLVMEPYAQGALIAPAVLLSSDPAARDAWLPRIVGGEALVVLAHQERGARYALNKTATRADSGRLTGTLTSTLTGTKSLVPAGDEADAFIVPAVDAQGLSLYLVERNAAGVSTRGYPMQDGSRGAELHLADTPATRLVSPDQAQAVLELAVDVGIAALCAEGVGAMERYAQLTAEYLNTRKQFGVPIASFQALRHRMADVKMQLELARSMSYFATLKLGAPTAERRRALSQAKVQLGASARFVGQQCTQLHGGIGVTDEYVGSHYFKRLAMMELQFGDSLHHLGIVSDLMEDTAGVFA